MPRTGICDGGGLDRVNAARAYANAIYLAPPALGLAVLAGIIERKGGQWQRAFLVVAAAPLVAAGLWLVLLDKPVRVEAVGPQTMLALWDMAGTKATLALVFALIATAAFAVRVTPQGRWITAFVGVNPAHQPIPVAALRSVRHGGLNFALVGCSRTAVPGHGFVLAHHPECWVRIGTLVAGTARFVQLPAHRSDRHVGTSLRRQSRSCRLMRHPSCHL